MVDTANKIQWLAS